MNRLATFLIAAVSGVLTWYAFYFLTQTFFPNLDASFIATVLIISVFVHEIGHAIALEKEGVRIWMFFLVVIGGVSPQKQSEAKYKELTDHKMAMVDLAGVIGNILVVLGALALWGVFDVLSKKDFLMVANLNGSLVVMNLLPIGFLDGGHFAKGLFNSIPEDKDTRFAVILSAVTVVIVLVASIWRTGDVPIFVFLLAVGMFRSAKNDDPKGCFSPKAMTKGQIIGWVWAYLLIFSIGCIYFFFTPNWME